MSCATGGTHCWHSSHVGAWHGVNPPPMICCHCGRTPESLHGPFAPHGGNWQTTTGTTISISGESHNVARTKTLLFDAAGSTVSLNTGGLPTARESHGPHAPKSQLNG